MSHANHSLQRLPTPRELLHRSDRYGNLYPDYTSFIHEATRLGIWNVTYTQMDAINDAALARLASSERFAVQEAEEDMERAAAAAAAAAIAPHPPSIGAAATAVATAAVAVANAMEEDVNEDEDEDDMFSLRHAIAALTAAIASADPAPEAMGAAPAQAAEAAPAQGVGAVAAIGWRQMMDMFQDQNWGDINEHDAVASAATDPSSGIGAASAASPYN